MTRNRTDAYLHSAVRLYARADTGLQRAQHALAHAVEGFLGSALTAAEKEQLTIALYDAQPIKQQTALAGWEERWFTSVLPPAPARLLLAAAGSGRELLPLEAAGYHVDAFEPADRHVSALTTRAHGAGEVVRGNFAELVSAVLQGETNSLSELSRRRYDAVILGWCSLTHVLEVEAQRALLRACVQLAGEGPVLASFWDRIEPEPHSRSRTLGAALGRQLAAARGVSTSLPRSQSFRTHCGFGHHFSRAEIEDLAATCDRTVQWGTDGFPHATLVSRARR